MRAPEQLHTEPAPQGAPDDPYRLRRREALYRWFAARCTEAGHRRVLDGGCRDGYGSAVLAAAGLDVVGIDHDVSRAARTYRFGRVVFRDADPTRTDEPQHTFDAIVSAGVLEHIPEPQSLFVEARRLLRPGGTLIVATPNRLTESPGRTRPIAGDHVWEFTPDELHKAASWRLPDLRMLGVFHSRRLRALERLLGASLPPTVQRIAPADRANWLRAALRRVRPGDFLVGPGVLREAIDLVAVARA